MTQEIPTSKENTDSVIALNDLNSKSHLTLKPQLEEEYDPGAHRDKDKCTSSSGALAHLLKGSLGAGILAMPMAFSHAGLLFGMIGSLLVGLLCTYCVSILVITSQAMCRILKVPALEFSETAEKVFEYGPPAARPWASFAKKFVDANLMITYFATITVYTVFIATSFHDVINYNYNIDWSVRTYIAIVSIPCLLMGQIRNLKWLVPFSTIANICIVVTFSITIYYMFRAPLVYSDKPLIVEFSKMPLFFATVVFGMEGIGAIMPVENSMKDPKRFLGCTGVLTLAMVTMVLLYTSIGFFGYVRFGDDVKASITLNLPEGSSLADAAKLLMAVAILCSYGLQYYAPSEILWGKFKHRFLEEDHNTMRGYFRAGLVVICSSIAIAVPNLEPFISLIGAVCLSLLGFFIPSLIETVYLWPNNLGWCKWKLIKNTIITIIAACALVSGTTGSIKQIIELYT